jgi:cell division protein FtsZ
MDTYNIFDELPDEEGNNYSSDREESFIDETPCEIKQIITSIDKTSEKLSNTTTTHTNSTNQTHQAMKFDLPEHSSIIKVIGVGGGGSNAVNHMYRQGIKGVDFIVCNTDKQALDMSPVPNKIVLGTTLTEGRGAGSIPEVGRNAAIENIEDIRGLLANNTKMVFITAGMGGGTGTGAAPIIAGIAREMGILTVAIVTVPFLFEGKKRRLQAEEGLEQLKQNVDTLLVVCNDKLREMYGNLKLSDAFSHADDVLAIAAKSIAEVISLTQQINVDFADVCTVMRNSGVAIMGSAVVSGENRSTRAVEQALNSPLLNDNNIAGARFVLLNIISGENEITMDELGEITDYIQEAAGQTAEIIKGYGVDPSLGDNVNVTIIATGFNQNNPIAYEYTKKQTAEKVVLELDENKLELVEAVQNELKAEVVNPLEPFLVSKQPEPIAEEKIAKVDIVNVLAPFIVAEEPVLETNLQEEIQEPIAEVTLEEEIVLPIAEVTLEEEIVLPIAEVTLVEEIIEPIAEVELTAEILEPVAESEVLEPVLNTNVEFEITNFTETETTTSNLELVIENNETPELVAEILPVASVDEIIVNAVAANEPFLIKRDVVETSAASDLVVSEQINEEELAKKIQKDEQQKKNLDRIQKLKELSLKLKTPKGLNEMEHEPAYVRKNINLDNVPHSSESQVSRYTLTENEEKKIEIRPNNSFLHDQVD